MEIEELAVTKPESIIKIAVEPAVGMQPFQAREIAFALGLDKSQVNQAVTTILGCYRAMRDLDATMVEINPSGGYQRGQHSGRRCEDGF